MFSCVSINNESLMTLHHNLDRNFRVCFKRLFSLNRLILGKRFFLMFYYYYCKTIEASLKMLGGRLATKPRMNLLKVVAD